MKEKEDRESEFLQYRREMKNTTQGNAVKELKLFKSMARQLEEELMKEKTKHQRHVSKHGQQYRELLEEVCQRAHHLLNSCFLHVFPISLFLNLYSS